MGKRRLGEFDAHRPALLALNREQRSALDEWRDGFQSVDNVLTWLLEFSYLSLGLMPDEWFSRVGTRRPLLAVLIVDEPARYRVYDTSVGLEDAREWREHWAIRDLRPACRRAYRELRWSATEYVESERPEPARGDGLAMRPALEEHRERQRDALTRLFHDGLEDVAAVVDLLHELDHATFGTLEFDEMLVESRPLSRALVDGEPWVRRWVAARWFLPAFNESVRSLAARAGESSRIEAENVEVVGL